MFSRIKLVDDNKFQEALKKFKHMTMEDVEFVIESESEMESEMEMEMESEMESESESVIYNINGENNYEKTVLSIDIGIRHLAFSLVTIDEEYNLLNIVGIDMIDITTFPHHNLESCTLHHQKTFSDWMAHIFEYYRIVFESVDKILVERQPPMGLVVIEQFIFDKYREKTSLVSPNSMHKHFNIGSLDYEMRKVEVERIFEYHIKDNDILKEYKNFDRQHDIADAFCISKFWLDVQHKKYLKQKEKDRIKNIQMTFRNSNLTMDNWFNQFLYRGPLQ